MFIKRFMVEECGLELSEYSLTAALVTVGILTAIGLLSGTLTAAFEALLGRITG